MDKKKILVIEDNEKHRDLLGLLFRLEGYEVETAETMNEVEEKTGGDNIQKYDLITLDIRIPGESLFDFINEKYKYFQNFIIVSAFAHDESMSGVFPKEIKKIKKPFGNKELISLVKEMIS